MGIKIESPYTVPSVPSLWRDADFPTYTLSCNGAPNSNVWYRYEYSDVLSCFTSFSVFIPQWDEYREVRAFAGKPNVDYNDRFTISIVDQDAWIVHATWIDNISPEINIVKFSMGNSTEIVQKIPLLTPWIGGIRCNFINDKVGYIFVTCETPDPNYEALGWQYKTVDGGLTWSEVLIVHAPIVRWDEHITFAKMITEQIGIVSGRFDALADSFSERTYVTKDGGQTWTPLPELTGRPVDSYQELVDLKVIKTADGQFSYCLLELSSRRNNDFYLYRYVSTDLETWVLSKGGDNGK